MTKVREYKIGDAMGRLREDPSGRRTYGYGHWGNEYKYTLYVYKGDSKGYLFSMSLPEVFISYIKGIVQAVSEKPLPENYKIAHNPRYWLRGKMWKRNKNTSYPLLHEEKRGDIKIREA